MQYACRFKTRNLTIRWYCFRSKFNTSAEKTVKTSKQAIVLHEIDEIMKQCRKEMYAAILLGIHLKALAKFDQKMGR